MNGNQRRDHRPLALDLLALGRLGIRQRLAHHPPMHSQLARHSPAPSPSPNSYSLRICSNSSTFALLSIPASCLFSRMLRTSGVGHFGASKWGRVASGITPRGSHGSGRADFPHPALRSTASLRDGGSADARLRQRIPLQQPFHLLHRYPCPLRAAAQPLSPRTDDTDREVVKRRVVSGDTEIPIVPQQLPLECCPLVANRFVPMKRDTNPRCA